MNMNSNCQNVHLFETLEISPFLAKFPLDGGAIYVVVIINL